MSISTTNISQQLLDLHDKLLKFRSHLVHSEHDHLTACLDVIIAEHGALCHALRREVHSVDRIKCPACEQTKFKSGAAVKAHLIAKHGWSIEMAECSIPFNDLRPQSDNSPLDSNAVLVSLDSAIEVNRVTNDTEAKIDNKSIGGHFDDMSEEDNNYDTARSCSKKDTNLELLSSQQTLQPHLNPEVIAEHLSGLTLFGNIKSGQICENIPSSSTRTLQTFATVNAEAAPDKDCHINENGTNWIIDRQPSSNVELILSSSSSQLSAPNSSSVTSTALSANSSFPTSSKLGLALPTSQRESPLLPTVSPIAKTTTTSGVDGFNCPLCRGSTRLFGTTQSFQQHLQGKHSLTIEECADFITNYEENAQKNKRKLETMLQYEPNTDTPKSYYSNADTPMSYYSVNAKSVASSPLSVSASHCSRSNMPNRLGSSAAATSNNQDTDKEAKRRRARDVVLSVLTYPGPPRKISSGQGAAAQSQMPSASAVEDMSTGLPASLWQSSPEHIWKPYMNDSATTGGTTSKVSPVRIPDVRDDELEEGEILSQE